MVSIHDVARRAKVSIGTVSRVLNESPQVTVATRRNVKRAINELGYSPNPSARALRSNRTRLIALTIPELTNPYFAAMVEGVQHVLAQAQFQLILCNAGADDKAEPEYLDMLARRQVDGLIVASRRFSAATESQKYLLSLGKKGFPIVSLGQRFNADPLYFDSISTDTSTGMREAMMHLLEAGHTEIAYFGAPEGIATLRLDTYKAALAERVIRVSSSLMFRVDPTLENGFKLAETLLRRRHRPTAIMAVNDIVAIGALMAFQEHGVSIPEEMSIVGFDDVPLASIIRPHLTTVFQPKYELGRLAAERLLGRLDKSVTTFRSISLSSRLVVRSSTARVRLKKH